jgi:hypothetical protein
VVRALSHTHPLVRGYRKQVETPFVFVALTHAMPVP